MQAFLIQLQVPVDPCGDAARGRIFKYPLLFIIYLLEQISTTKTIKAQILLPEAVSRRQGSEESFLAVYF